MVGIREFSGFVKIVRTAVEKRHCYASIRDVWLSVLYGLALTRTGTRLVGERIVRLRLRGLPGAVQLRTCTTDFWVVRDIFEDNAYEAVPLLELPPNPVILDLGAHIGLATLHITASLDDPFVVCVEPDPGNFRLLRDNCAEMESRGMMIPVNGFVAAADGVAGIERILGTWGYRKVPAKPSAETIPCFSVQGLLERHDLKQIDLLKCDIEGTEQELFADCSGWVSRVGSMIVETHDTYDPKALYADLRRADWQFEILFEQQNGRNHVCFLRQQAVETRT